MRMNEKCTKDRKICVRWLLVGYDLLIYIALCLMLFSLSLNEAELTMKGMLLQGITGGVVIICVRLLAGVYRQIWRYGGIQSFFRLLVADAVAFLIYYSVQIVLFFEKISFVGCLTLVSMNLLGALTIRIVYRYTYKCCKKDTWYGRVLYSVFGALGASHLQTDKKRTKKTKVAIIGAGRLGNALAEELFSSIASPYEPVLFIDSNKQKTGREIHGIPVIHESKVNIEYLTKYEIQEVILAVQRLSVNQKKNLYEKYKDFGCKVKVYDYPVMETAGRRSIRKFDVEELLFRKPMTIELEKAKEYYKGKRILITGGGGSIGSEICRQLAKMSPEQLIILDICENGAYDIQQEIKMKYSNQVKVNIEIASVMDKVALQRVFAEYHPQVVIMAAAHKHVPLMEKNCIEAVKNNIFGTVNTVDVSEEYGAERVIMVSTDKAVNPTSVMGATKRMCEMIVQSRSAENGKTTYSTTRFGNVLGSAGSVIPLFKKQIAYGGPVTITDKRIIRYFMTIPEASQLVLLSGAMAKNGELFVLDMGQPIKIYDLAKTMIRLSGVQNIDIIETGLRPGEKLYEELLVKTEELGKTENEMIFVERDTPLNRFEIADKLQKLRDAIMMNSDIEMKKALKVAVPTYNVKQFTLLKDLDQQSNELVNAANK